MTAQAPFRVAELDFDQVRSNLIAFLRSQSEFQDYDFDGAGLSVLIDLLAYNTHYMGYYLNMVGNEMFLDTAQLRSSIVSHAQQIDYRPGSMKGARAVVNITITPEGAEDTTLGTLTLPDRTTFVSSPISGVSYLFSTIAANTSPKVNGSFTFSNVALTQGIPVTQKYAVNNTKKFLIPSANVDVSTLEVSVQASAANTFSWIYQEATDITEITANSQVYFLEENPDTSGFYTLVFGDGVLGQQLSQDNIITVKYLDTNGTYANKANNFVPSSAISGYSANVIVSPVSAAAGGSDKETVEQVRQRAPIAFTAQNRAVTKNDYQSLLLDDYPNIDAISVWSGDENDPPVYGKVFISMKPKQDYIISLTEKQNIIDQIIAQRSVLTVTPEIVDPDYTYILTNITVNYDPKKTDLDETQLKQLIRQAVLDYKASDLETFDSTFRMSRIQNAIDNADDSIIGSSVRIYLQKRATLTLNQNQIYTFNFNTPLYRGVIEDKFYTYPDVTVLDNQGIARQVFIEDTPNSLTGLDSITVLSAGSGYLTAPTVTIVGDGSGATAEAQIVNGRVNGITITNRGVDYTTATAQITSDSGSGATASVGLQARNGTLRSYYYKGNGEKVVVDANIGSIDYVKGTIIINSLNPSAVTPNDRYALNILTFNARPFNDVITPSRDRILDIDATDSSSIVITLVPES